MTEARRIFRQLIGRAWRAEWPIWAEIICFVALMALYESLRTLVAPDSAGVTTAFANAERVVDLERALGLFVEGDLHAWTVAHEAVQFATTWYYTLAYVAGYLVTFTWTWFRRRPYFAAFRNWRSPPSPLPVSPSAASRTSPPRPCGWAVHSTGFRSFATSMRRCPRCIAAWRS